MIDIEQFKGHTPGKWRVEQDTTLIWGNCNPEDSTTWGMGYPVASAEFPREWTKGRPFDEEIAANARLIASAPDLLAEVVRLREALVAITAIDLDTQSHDWAEIDKAKDIAYAALGATP